MSDLFVDIEPAVIEWREGLPYSTTYCDVYFSGQDGLSEKTAVFIDGNQLAQRFGDLNRDDSIPFVIGEVGFGAGLNFLLTWACWQKHAPAAARLHYFSCEKHPLTRDDLSRCLQLWPALATVAQPLVDQYPALTPGFHQLYFQDKRITLTLMLGDAHASLQQLLASGDKALEAALNPRGFDAWYLDGFSPARNQQAWSQALFSCIALLSRQGTTVATYSAAAAVKSGLLAVGFSIKKIKGHGHKRHRIIGQFQQALHHHKPRYTPWHIGLKAPAAQKRAIIVGAGLAGCCLANALAARRWGIHLIDSGCDWGSGASANEQAVLYPNFSAYAAPLTELMLAGFLYAQRFYLPYLNNGSVDGAFDGLLQLIDPLDQPSLRQWLQDKPELARFVSQEEAGALAGWPVKNSALFVPRTGWLNSRQLCAALVKHAGITSCLETPIHSIVYNAGQWWVGEKHADIVVICNGYQANLFEQTAYLPLKPIRGQMTFLLENQNSQSIKIPICGDGHLLPSYQGLHAVGASYELGCQDGAIRSEDDQQNLAKLASLMPEPPFSSAAIKANWAGIRAATPDYLPVVGEVVNQSAFMNGYADLVKNANLLINKPAPTYPGLYVCAGFGSRGLTTIPLTTDWLASHIAGERAGLSRRMIQSLAPSRFLRKQIIRRK